MLATRIEDKSDISFGESEIQLFRILSKHYLSDRYPDFLNKSGETVSQEEASNILKRTKVIFTWLMTMKPSEN
jgi:HEPN domain-containing protein